MIFMPLLLFAARPLMREGCLFSPFDSIYWERFALLLSLGRLKLLLEAWEEAWDEV